MKEKYFIITVDTEGDNLWERATTPNGIRDIGINNAKYIERFQKMCADRGFIPTYLTDYEMIMSDEFVSKAKKWQKNGECEIGMHMHAWNCPPLYVLNTHRRSHNPYAGEYPHEIMWEKMKYLTELIEERTGTRPKSHRGGRWYIDEWYISKLIELGYIVDCSITPGVSWESSIGNEQYGPNYSNYKCRPFYMDSEKKMIQIPPTIIPNKLSQRIFAMKKAPYDMKEIMNTRIWLRPNGTNLEQMIYIVQKYKKADYLEFMIHSSELMPGGSPTFKNQADIEKLYDDLNILFEVIEKKCSGISLGRYAEMLSKKVIKKKV